MKKIIAWLPAQICYYLGHWTSRVMEKLPGADEEEPGRVFNLFFNIYQFFMRKSFRLSEWADLGMWNKPETPAEGGEN